MNTAERAVAYVSRGSVTDNCRLLKERLAPGCELCAVVKADGYGHGATESARAALAGGATTLAVVSATEAVELREAGLSCPLLVMGALSRQELELALMQNADLVAWSAEFVESVTQSASPDRPVRLHLKFDSGMGRLGEPDPEVVFGLAEHVASSEQLELTGLMTHFATADDRNNDFFDLQLERFSTLVERIRAQWPSVCTHAANSAAVLRDPAAHFDMVRCGIAIYGMDPFGEDPRTQGLLPALALKSYVAQRKRISVGDSVGYGRRFIASVPTEIATLPIGYGDGVRRGLTNNAEVLIGGRRYPLVGTVSMDNITVDLGTESGVEVGDEAVLLGTQGDEAVLAEEWAGRLATINYEITCGISARVSRQYHEG